MVRKTSLGWWEYDEFRSTEAFLTVGKGMNSLDIEIDIVIFLSAYTSRCPDVSGKGGCKKVLQFKWKCHITLSLFCLSSSLLLLTISSTGLGIYCFFTPDGVITAK